MIFWKAGLPARAQKYDKNPAEAPAYCEEKHKPASSFSNT